MATPTIVGTPVTTRAPGPVTTFEITSFTAPAGESNTILIVMVSSPDNMAASATWNGDAMTIAASNTPAQRASERAFYLVNPDTGNNTLSVTMSAQAGNGAKVCIFVLKDAKQSSPIDAAVTNNGGGGSTSSANTITNSEATSITLYNTCVGESSTNYTNVGAGVTIGSQETGQDDYFGYNTADASGGLSVGYTWTTGNSFDAYAFGVKYEAGSPGATGISGLSLLGVGT